jgi:hypothetical protein
LLQYRHSSSTKAGISDREKKSLGINPVTNKKQSTEITPHSTLVKGRMILDFLTTKKPDDEEKLGVPNAKSSQRASTNETTTKTPTNLVGVNF